MKKDYWLITGLSTVVALQDIVLASMTWGALESYIDVCSACLFAYIAVRAALIARNSHA